MSPLMFLQSPFRWLQAISRYGATTSGGPNFAYDLCVRKITPEQRSRLDLSSWDLAFNGAEPISHETIERFTETFAPCGFRREAFYPCYGMAEATLIISGGLKALPPKIETFAGTALEQNQIVAVTEEEEQPRTMLGCGGVLANQRIAIVDPETLTQCAEGELGEIWVSGESIALGYWQNPEATKETFHAYLADTKEGPFLRTGDLGFFADGELFVTGRLKDVVIINGRNYYPHDIERTVEQSHPDLRPNCSAAFSVKIAGEERSIVIAEVERSYHKRRQKWHKASQNASQPSGSVDSNELIRSIRQAVLKYHNLQVYRALLLKPGSIPKTSSGKIQRYACRAAFLAKTLDLIEY